MFQPRTDLLEAFLSAARSHLGYRARPGGLSDFGKTVGYYGHDLPWSGAFIDVVAREAGISAPACVYTPSGLAEFAQQGRLKSRPRPGDIVFFSFATDKDFGMPHVGIVLDTRSVRETDRFTTIEAQVNAGLPKASKDLDGVFERSRWVGDVISFARPDFRRRPAKGSSTDVTDSILIDETSVRPGRRNNDVATVQLALTQICDLRMHRLGTWDSATKEAFARYQRMIGIVGSQANGVPNLETLGRLGRDSGRFRVS